MRCKAEIVLMAEALQGEGSVVYAPGFLTLVIAPVLAALAVLFSVPVSVPVPAHIATPKHQKSSAPASTLTAQPKLGQHDQIALQQSH